MKSACILGAGKYGGDAKEILMNSEREYRNVLDYEVIENIEILYSKRIIIYGTGGIFNNVMPLVENAKLDVIAVCDSNQEKHGSIAWGYLVQDISSVLQEVSSPEVLIVILSTYTDEIMEHCLSVDNSLSFVTTFGLRYAFLLNRKNKVLKEDFRRWYNERYDSWALLNNDKYREVWTGVYMDSLLDLKNNDSILMYTSAKVGTTSVWKTLLKNGIPAFATHHYNPAFTFMEKSTWQKYKDYIQECIKNKERIRIITGVRDPLSRDISQIFQVSDNPSIWLNRNLDYHFCDSVQATIKEYFALENFPEAEYGNDMHDGNRRMVKGSCGWTFNWFNVELKEMFGIDVYQYAFDKEKGYTIIKQGNVECLVLKLEKLDECKGIVAQFAGVDNLEWENSNRGELKKYKFVYDKVKKNIVIDKEILDFYYSGECIRHFYTEEEIEILRKKWQRI